MKCHVSCAPFPKSAGHSAGLRPSGILQRAGNSELTHALSGTPELHDDVAEGVAAGAWQARNSVFYDVVPVPVFVGAFALHVVQPSGQCCVLARVVISGHRFGP